MYIGLSYKIDWDGERGNKFLWKLRNYTATKNDIKWFPISRSNRSSLTLGEFINSYTLGNKELLPPPK